ncbi:MAG: CcmD family protein [Saprospiraceae bacterium]|nr:CcmD family protein [Saprospiraceae bacterium]
MRIRILSIFCLLFGTTIPLSAQDGGLVDFMDSIGKIYVVVGVILVIFIGLVIYLIRLDRKIARLENQIMDND